MHAQRRARRGFTLLELVIGSALGALVTLAAFSFVRTQSRHLGLTSQSVDMAQVGRAAMEMLIDDVHYAGAGLGPRADGTFPGIMTGAFRFGTVQFNTNATTDDVGIMLARGPYTTIAAYDATGTAEVCDVPNLAS